MKKILATVLVLVILVASLSSCSLFDKYSARYEYVSAESYGEYSQMRGTLDFIYVETFLKIYGDGSWNIDVDSFIPIGSPLDKGTYTKSGDTYKFTGFEYGLETYGEETEDGGFVIYMKAPYHSSVTNAIVLNFKKA